MRVNITYSVDLDDVPEYIIGLINKGATAEIEKSLKSLKNTQDKLVKEKNINETITTINDVREKLSLAEARLSECNQILIGYQSILFSDNQKVEKIATDTANQLDTLTEQLNSLQAGQESDHEEG
jgi:uncharacterized phage infection (PIP) family protein YhgE